MRLPIVICTAMLALLATFTAASAHSGDVTAQQDCRTWSVHVSLNHNTTPDRTRVGVTAGAGLTFNNTFQIDIAGTFVADARNLIVSVVRRLK